MYSTKILQYLLLFGGLIIISIGCYMKINEITSTGSPYSNRFGVTVQPGTLNGNGTILFGILILILSVITYFKYILEKKKREKIRKEEEINEIKI